MIKTYIALLISLLLGTHFFDLYAAAPIKASKQEEAFFEPETLNLPGTRSFSYSKENLSIPITGMCTNGFEEFDKAILEFLTARGFDCATLAIIKDGKFLVKRGYGWSNKNKTKLTSPDDYFRIASLSKIFTCIAINNLITNNQISYETPMIQFLGYPRNGHDQKLNKINIFHLMFHQGGWNSDRTLDPLLSIGIVANKLNKKISDLKPNDITKYIIENIKLDFEPATNTKYSNVGYLFLGRIIEKVSKTSYLDFINNVICKPANARVEIGPSRLSNRSPSEIEYYKSNDLNLNNDLISLKASDSTFGLVTSAPNLCKVFDKYWIEGELRKAGEQRQLLKTGTLIGVTAIARQRYSGATIVVLINSRDNNNPEMDNNALKQLIDNAANKCKI